jgi:hypothetical protein
MAKLSSNNSVALGGNAFMVNTISSLTWMMLCILCGASLVSWSPAKAAVFTVGSLGAPNNGGGGNVCMDVGLARLKPGTLVIAFPCHASGNQQFELSGTTIYAMGGTRCIDVKGATRGSQVDSSICTGRANQVWVYDDPTPGSILNPISGLCLDATTMTNNVVLVINKCNGSAGQIWQIK